MNEEKSEKSEAIEYMKILKKDVLIAIGGNNSKDSLLIDSVKKLNELSVKTINKDLKELSAKI